MNPGWIVGISIAVLVLLTGIIGLANSRKRRSKNKWALWFVIFGICAIASAFINAHFSNH